MKQIDREQFAALLKTHRVKQRLSRELRFNPDEIQNWDALDMLAITTRGKGEGLLFVETDDFYVIPYELTLGMADKKTGRSKPITCDLCMTWQQGSKAGLITFERRSDKHTFTYLCCSDLKCSLHVRNMTPEATLSRTQLREDIDVAGRVSRFHERLGRIIGTISAQ